MMQGTLGGRIHWTRNGVDALCRYRWQLDGLVTNRIVTCTFCRREMALRLARRGLLRCLSARAEALA